MNPIIVGIAGGSGSGKSYLAHALHNMFGKQTCALLYQDNYYIDQSAKFDFDGGSVNFDHPDSLDFTLLGKHLAELKNGSAVEVPIYDFATHTRKSETIHLRPHPIILVDGILILQQEKVRKHFDFSMFVDTPEEVRFNRRLERDVNERGRTPEGVKNQFYKQVAPMHDQFVEPSKEFASHHLIHEGEDDFDSVINNFYNELKSKI